MCVSGSAHVTNCGSGGMMSAAGLDFACVSGSAHVTNGGSGGIISTAGLDFPAQVSGRNFS